MGAFALQHEHFCVKSIRERCSAKRTHGAGFVFLTLKREEMGERCKHRGSRRVSVTIKLKASKISDYGALCMHYIVELQVLEKKVARLRS